MLTVKTFVFNPFQENTYVLYDETRESVIIDAGNADDYENAMLTSFIQAHQLVPKLLLSTHGHVDHILGNAFLADSFGLQLAAHPEGFYYFEQAPRQASLYGMTLQNNRLPDIALSDGEILTFGNTQLEVIFTPGHADGSVSFYCKQDSMVFTGDLLFNRSIGRTDMQGGNYRALEQSLKTRIYTLPDATTVFPGHGCTTEVGDEKRNNPFVTLLN